MSAPMEYRIGNHQPQNVYRGDQYIGVMFSPIDAAAVVNALNNGHGECCGVGICTCSDSTDGGDA